jgi:uncharacterized membrane protein (UPF0127 family)
MTGRQADRLRVRRPSDGVVVCAPLRLGESFSQRFMGLMGRSSLADGEGLYLPTSSIHMFFMRFAIDCAFLGPESTDGERAVVALRHRLPAWTGIVWHAPGARGVVELAPGALERSGTKVGDLVRLETATRS